MTELNNDYNEKLNEKLKVAQKEKKILISILCCLLVCFAMNLEGIIRYAIEVNNFWIFYLICEIISVSAIIIQVYSLVKVEKLLKRLKRQINSSNNSFAKTENDNEPVELVSGNLNKNSNVENLNETENLENVDEDKN